MGKFFLSLLFISAFLPADAQTIYRLKYKSPFVGDTAIYDAFFSLSSNGTGIARIRSSSNRDISEIQFTGQFATDKNGMIDTGMLVYQGTNPQVIGNRSKKVSPVTYWFKVNAENYSDPWNVTDSSVLSAPDTTNFLSAEFISNKDMTRYKDLVRYFFTDTSAYYNNLFGPKSKGVALTPDERKNTRMFLIVVASTKDQHLLPNCLIDARKMVSLFSDIAGPYGMGIRLFVDSVYGDKYSKASVEAALKRLKPTKKDIVVFYYSGHGFTDRRKENKEFPFLDLRDPSKTLFRRDLETQVMNIQDIYDTIVSKGARLNLVLSDCCNDTIAAKKVTAPATPGHKGLTKVNADNLRTLFMNKIPINLLMTAASRDERATVTPSYNSYFTNFFVESLRTYLSPEKGNPNWYRVLSDTHTMTRLYAGRVPCPAEAPCPDGKMLRQTPKILLPAVIR